MRDTGHRTPMQGGMGYCAGGRGTSYQAGRLEMIRGPGDTTVKTHKHAGWGMRDVSCAEEDCILWCPYTMYKDTRVRKPPEVQDTSLKFIRKAQSDSGNTNAGVRDVRHRTPCKCSGTPETTRTQVGQMERDTWEGTHGKPL